MPWPEREYYALHELCERWEVGNDQLRHVIETGHLNCCIRVRPCWMNMGMIIRESNGYESFKPSERIWVSGFVYILKEDCYWLFHNDACEIRLFGSIAQESCYLQLVNDDSLKVGLKNLIVLCKEVRRFETRHQIVVRKCIANLNSNILEFRQGNQYQTVWFKGKEYRFGYVQAQIVKQLYEASLSDSPWVHGKILLNQAGSQSGQLKNVFRSQQDWREVIESDGRGYYRLSHR